MPYTYTSKNMNVNVPFFGVLKSFGKWIVFDFKGSDLKWRTHDLNFLVFSLFSNLILLVAFMTRAISQWAHQAIAECSLFFLPNNKFVIC